MQIRQWLGATTLSAAFLGVATVSSQSADTTPANQANPPKSVIYTFGTLRAIKLDDAKAKTMAVLQANNKFDLPIFEAIWSEDSASVFDRTVQSLSLARPEFADLLHGIRSQQLDAPLELPAALKDTTLDPFAKANLATAYAKNLATRRVFEEALEALRVVQPEHVVDPAVYYFYKAVCEHSLMQKDAAVSSITRLLDDVAETPDRYKMVATLMFFDMQNWSADSKDLGNISRLMDNSGRRLDLSRAGKQTQDIQKKIIFRLDEKIKEMENKAKSQGSPNQGQCPSGGEQQPGPGGTNQPQQPASDSQIMGGGGDGKVDDKKLKKLAEEWGKLPASERAKAIQEITRDLPPKYRQMIEEYFKSLNKLNSTQP